MNEAKELGQRLAAARKRAGISIRQAARQLGKRHPAIIDMEKGRRKVSALELVAMAEMYQVTLTDLTGAA